MKVIYTRDTYDKCGRIIHHLCELGEVANGYANFLIKMGEVVPGTPENRVKYSKIREKILDEYCQELHYAMQDADKLKDKEFTVEKKATPRGTISESITKNDICELLDTPTIESKMLKTDIIKTFGKHTVTVVRHPEVRFDIIINVREI